MKPLRALLMSTALVAGSAGFAENVSVPLWPEGVPNAKSDLGDEKVEEGRISNISVPTLTYFGPAVDRPNGTAVIICPGGGYGMLSNHREGVQYATWLSTLGVTSFIIKNRLAE